MSTHTNHIDDSSSTRHSTALHGRAARAFVVLPTVAVSWLLGLENIALAPRLAASLGLGMLLMGLVSLARRRSA
jgi:hypothetical protein